MMDEAIQSLQQTPTPNHAQRQAMSRAIRVVATQAAIREVKAAIQRQGKVEAGSIAGYRQHG